ncbi:hypothetical protein ACERIT_08750 [Halopenitus sp. H-Gu1]|uniref:hypothetical protein n=1 Tax=Halopenitus sp. H-Gu1 TaxID=3242697 RepID=UPI00359CD39F
MTTTDFSPDIAPNAPTGWKRITNEPAKSGEGYHASYRRVANGMTADIDLHSAPDTDVVKVVIDDYTDRNDPETRTRRVERTVSKIEDVETLEEVATEWVEKARKNDL